MDDTMHVGDHILIAQNSWAGVSRTRAVILKVCPKRYRVRWIDAGIGHYAGHESYVPRWACTKDTRGD